MTTILGLDISLRSAGACVIPSGWVPGDWDSLFTMTVGSSVKGRDPQAMVERVHMIAHQICDFAGEHGVTDAFVEDYAFGSVSSKADIGEATGAVKFMLFNIAGIVTIPVNQSTIRKYLLGKLPAGKGKGAIVQEKLKKMGARFATSDAADAFVVANYGLTEVGLTGLTLSGA
jgi:Holliday junction resolvasome RuvABC endonuclease subunit